MARWPKALSCGALLLLAACAGASDEDPRLTSAIRGYYAAHATEEQGACRSPKIDSIQDRHVLERSAEGGEVMLVRYSYFDRHADMDADWSRLVYLSQPCGGIAERRFEIIRGATGYQVTGMSGERRDGEGRR
ncbi:MAG: hypothetical protein R3F54_23595 [Alphaproteobacteria bacterium]